MKKIYAFITAFVLFVCFAICFNFCIRDENIDIDKKTFGTWVNTYKDLSYNAISKELDDKSMIVYGSSEFDHGKTSIYHPSNLFKKQNINLMLIGNAYNQTLSHAISLSALEPKLKTRKVVLILSPTWFYEQGVTPDHFSLRFSESSYMELMSNKDISKSTKEYIASRSEELLALDPFMLKQIKRYNRIFLSNNANFIDKSIYSIRRAYKKDQDILTVNMALKTSKINHYNGKKNPPRQGIKSVEWGILANNAVKKGIKHRTNPYGMNDKIFNKKMKKKLKYAKNSHKKDSFKTSPEYEDLRCFLKICKETNIKPLIILQPVNGYWYDYTGLTKIKRQVLQKDIQKIALEYNAKLADFTDEEYSKYFFGDNVHPSGGGWIKLNEKIYKFYNDDNF